MDNLLCWNPVRIRYRVLVLCVWILFESPVDARGFHPRGVPALGKRVIP
jgi:hypothetical protein